MTQVKMILRYMDYSRSNFVKKKKLIYYQKFCTGYIINNLIQREYNFLKYLTLFTTFPEYLTVCLSLK